MRKSIRSFSALATLFFVFLLALLVAAPVALSGKTPTPTPTATATPLAPSPGRTPPPTAPWTGLPPVLYVGGDLSLTGTAKLSSPTADGSPTAALLVKGLVTNTSSGSVSTVQYVSGNSTGFPTLSTFTDKFLSTYVGASPKTESAPGTAQKFSKGLTVSGTRDQTFGDINVTGTLTITGSGKYTFGKVFVSGNVVIKNTLAKISIDVLRVGGSLDVNGCNFTKLGPTYVAGNTSLIGSSPWAMDVLVTDGSLTIGGTQSMGSAAAPAKILVTGSAKTMTLGGSVTYYGMLCNTGGGFYGQSTSKIYGSVLCAGSATMQDSCLLTYDPTVGTSVLGVTPPTTSAVVNGTSVSSGFSAWYVTSPVPISLSAIPNAWTKVTGITYSVNGVPRAISGSTGSFTVPLAPYPVPPDGIYTVKYWAQDAVGNSETAKTIKVKIDTKAPSTGSNAPTEWQKSDVTVTLTPSDPGFGDTPQTGSGVASTFCKVDGASNFSQDTSVKITAAGNDGIHTITYYSADAAGNQEATQTCTVKIDTAAPMGSFTINNGVEWTDSPHVTLNVTASDGSGAGGVQVRFSNDVAGLTSATWHNKADDFPWTLADPTVDGSKTVYAQFQDSLGNQTSETDPVSATITLSTGPSVTLSNKTEGSSLYNEPVFHFTADPGSGQNPVTTGPVASLAKLDGESWIPVVMPVESDKPLPMPLPDGSYRLSVTATDSVGATTTKSCQFDVLAPPITVKQPAPYAGDQVGLYASTTWNPDGGWSSKSYEWNVRHVGLAEPNWVSFEDPIAFITPGVKGTYDVELTVTDDAGLTKTGARCVVSSQMTVGALKPRVHALDVVVSDGQQAELVGRFVDPAWEETHTATWHIDGLSADPEAYLTEDNLAAMNTGIVEGVTPPLRASAYGSTLYGHLTVSGDVGGASTEVDFTITIRQDGKAADEGSGPDYNNKITPGTPQIKNDGELLQSYIQSSGDIDIFEVTKPDGTPLDCGTQVLVTLRDLPADYDVAVVGDFTTQPEYSIPKADLEGTSFPTSGTVNAGRLQFAGARIVSGGGGRIVSGGGGRIVSGGGGRIVSGGGGRIISGGGGRIVSGGGGRIVSGGGGAIDDALYNAWTGSMSLTDSAALADTIGIGGGRIVSGGGGRIVSGGGGRIVSGGGGRIISGGGGEAEAFYRDPDSSALYSYFAPPLDGEQAQLLQGYPLSDMSFTQLDANTTSGSDVTLEELGFNHEDMNNRYVAGFSAASGTKTEVVLATVELVNGRTYIAVKGANGAFSEAAPYTLQVETTPAINYTKLWNEGKTRSVKVTSGRTTSPSVAYTGRTDPNDPLTEVTDPQTLFVTQPQRLDVIYQSEQTPYESAVYPALKDACDSSYTGYGAILNLPSSIYDVWDTTPWDTDLANGVTDQIKSSIEKYIYGDSANQAHPSIKYVILVGSDDVIPQRRVIDQTSFDNERLYAGESGLDMDSPLQSGLYDAQILTDDFYVDKTPIPYNSRWLYVPDLVVSRLVETPVEIAGVVDKFVDDDHGVLAGGGSVVTGQEFMKDGAQRVADILTAAELTAKVEPFDTWSLQNLNEDLPGRNVVNLDAHFLHYGGVSAAGYRKMQNGEDWSSEFFDSTQIAQSDKLGGKLVFTLGCHAGLSVSKDQAHATWGEIDASLDVPQAMARQKGVLVASTGYGLGDWTGIAATEDLLARFADQVTTDTTSSTQGQPIGQALTLAKRQYFLALSAVTAYDEKSSIDLTMYGMPQYRLPCKTKQPPSAGDVVKSDPYPPAAQSQTVVPGALPTTDFTLTVADGTDNMVYDSHLIEPASDTATARYITVDGDSQSTADRPTQPRIVIDLGPAGDSPVSGAVLTDGTYKDIADFDPAITSVTAGWYVDSGESQAYADGMWPASPVTVTTIATPTGRRQQLVIVPGQFYATAAGDNGIIGTERVWTDIKVKLIRTDTVSQPDQAHLDLLGPEVGQVTLSHVGDDYTAVVEASDRSGISKIGLTQIGAQDAQYFSQSFDPAQPGLYEVHFTLPGVDPKDVSLMLEAYDRYNNLTTYTAKGFLVTGPPTGTMTLNNGLPVTYNRTVGLDSSNVVNARDMRFSFDGTTWTEWTTYMATAMVTFAEGTGQKDLWVEYRNADPHTLVLSASVQLDSPPMEAGGANSFAIGADGMLSVWGNGGDGRLGDGDLSSHTRLSPWKLTTQGFWAQLSVSGHALAVRPNGSLYAWGYNNEGQLGDGTQVNKADPTGIVGDGRWTALAPGGAHSLGVRDGRLYSWGWNAYGELGNGGVGDNVLTPQPIGTDTDWVGVAASDASSSFGLKSDGSLFAWGLNSGGSLGDGTTTSRNVPTRIGTDNDWTSISCDSLSVLALKADGSLWAWGDNGRGQLGDGGTIDQHSPERIGIDNDWVAVSTGNFHSLALKADGTLWTWGWNAYGQLGDGSTNDSPIPIRVGQGHVWVAISAGSAHSLALDSNGDLYAWGWNLRGQLGDDTQIDRDSPTSVVSDLIDITAPTTSVSDTSGWHKAAVPVTFSSADGVSIEYRVGSALTWTKVTGNPATITVPAPSQDDYVTVWYRSTDSAGNVENEKSITLQFDTTGPSAIDNLSSPTHSIQTNWYSNANPSFSWDASSDSGSGLAGYSYIFSQDPGAEPDAVAEPGGSGTTTASYSGTADGTWNFKVCAVDNAGNMGPVSTFTVNIDTIPPLAINASTLTSSHKFSSLWYSSREPSFSWVPPMELAGSGLAGYSYTFSQNDTDTPDNVADCTASGVGFTDVADGLWRFRVRAVDGAGNASSVSSYNIQIDGTPPDPITGLASSNPQNTPSDNANPTFTWNAGTDTGGSGINGYSYTFSQDVGVSPDNKIETGLTSVAYSGVDNGTWYFRVRAVDDAGAGGPTGNAGEISTYTIEIDTTHTITASAGSNGMISPNGAVTVNHGGSQVFTITPDANHHLTTLTLDGVDVKGDAVFYTGTGTWSYTLTNVTADHTLTASFAIDSYTVTPLAGLHGVIDPASAQTLTHGGSQSFTITPDANYHLESLTLNGTSVKNDASFDGVSKTWSYTVSNVTGDRTLFATFAIDTYTVTPQAGANGTISPATAQTVNHGGSQVFTITPDANHHLTTLTLDGVDVKGDAVFYTGTGTWSYTLTNVTADHTLTASFAINSFTLTYNAGTGGSITGVTPQTVDWGTDGTPVTATPAEGYHFVKWSDDVLTASRTDTVVKADLTVTAQFAIDLPPTGDASINQGRTITYSSLVGIDSTGVDGATEMRTSADNGATWSAWTTFATKSVAALPALPGSKTLTVQYRNGASAPLEISASLTLALPPLAVGGNHGIAVKADGSLFAWGHGGQGQRGDGTTTDSLWPKRAGSGTDWAAPTAGWVFSLGLKTGGTLWGWGQGPVELGLQVPDSQLNAPMQVGNDASWATIVAGNDFSVALKDSGELWDWGNNTNGELGRGNTYFAWPPARVGLAEWTTVKAGQDHAIGIQRDGTLYTWGSGWNGRLGDGLAHANTQTPTKVPGTAAEWASVCAGSEFSLAIKNNGELWAWGDDSSGELGDGRSGTIQVTPKRIGTATDWVALAAGADHTLALKTDGTLWAWGHNGYGQIGDGTTTMRTQPVQVGTSTDWVAVAAGSSGANVSLALKADGTVWGWGQNGSGEVGDGTTVQRTSPVKILDMTDTTAPNVTISSPANTGTVTTSTPQLIYDSGDARPSTVVVKVDGTTVSTTSGQNINTLSDGSHTVTVTARDWGANETTATSTFTVDTRVALTLTSIGLGTVAKVPDQAKYTLGSSVQLTATPEQGWQFDSWGGGATGAVSPLTVTMDSAKTITATFVVDPATLLNVTTLAGTAGLTGSVDGTGSAARFFDPGGVTSDPSGNVYVADRGNDTIRKITPDGVVTTFAGLAGSPGSTDGNGSAARFNQPEGVACDSTGNLFVADTGNNTIRRITPNAEVTTFAGTAGQSGSADGAGSEARFDRPKGVACDATGNVYVADTFNETIRRIAAGGVVTTHAGSAGNFGSADGTGTAARFNKPWGVACNAGGDVYVADYGNATIRKITSVGVVTTVAGSATNPGFVDGSGSAARFAGPVKVACDSSGNVYVVEYANPMIRKVTSADVVTTVAGSPSGWGSDDGTGTAAKFRSPEGIGCDAVGNLYIADTQNATIRKAVCPATVGGFIRVTQGSHGTISLSGETGPAPEAVAVQHANSQSFTVTPDARYHLSSLTLGSTDVMSAATDNDNGTWSYTVTNVTADRTLTATFAINQYTLTYTAGEHGSIDGSSPQTVDYGANGTEVAGLPATGYHFVKWSDESTANPRTDTNVQGDITVTAQFAINDTGPTYQWVRDVPKADFPYYMNGFDQPITVDPANYLWWADSGRGFFRFDSAANWTMIDNFNHLIQADDVAMGNGPSGGQVWATDYSQKRVVRFSASGSYLGFYTVTGTQPYGLAVNSDGSYWVSNMTTGDKFIGKYNSSGNLTYQLYDPRFSAPQWITLDKAGNLYVSDWGANKVFEFSPSGTPVADWSSANAYGITFDADGLLYVVNRWQNKVMVYTAAGTLVTTFGDGTQLLNPGDIAVGPDGLIYVVDESNHRVRVYQKVVPTADTYTVTPVARANGAISPSTAQTVASGGSQSFTITPDAHYRLDTLTLDSSDVKGAATYDGGSKTWSYTVANVTGDRTIVATFAIDQFALTYTAGANGSITGQASQTVDYGGSGSQVTAVPSNGYHFVSWSDGKTDNPRTDANVTANLNVIASFEVDTPPITQYTLTYAAGTNGTITGDGSQTVNEGADGTAVTATPNPGWVFSNWSDGCLLATRIDWNVKANLSVGAVFIPRGGGWVSVFSWVRPGSGGTIVPSGTRSVPPGTAIPAYEISPSPGYHTIDVLVDGVSVGTPTSYNFGPVTVDHSITARFAMNTYTITANAGAGGSISPSGPTTVNYGSELGFRITPDSGYRIEDVKVDGLSVGAVGVYGWASIDRDHTIEATFAVDTRVALTLATMGQGSVDRLPAETSYELGTSVQLTAIAEQGWQFAGWSGDASGAANPLTVTMDGAKNISATFVADLAFLQFVRTYADTGLTPTGIAADGNGNVYVANDHAQSVEKFDAAGRHLATIGGPGSGDGQFGSPRGVAVFDGELYVSDVSPGTPGIEVFGLDGIWNRTITAGWLGGSGWSPSVMAFDPSGNMLVLDGARKVVDRLTTDGTYIESLPISQLQSPIWMDVDEHGNMYVSEQWGSFGNGTGRVYKFSPSGSLLTQWDLPGHPYSWAAGIAVDSSQGLVYVVDAWDSCRCVNVFEEDGTPVATFRGAEGGGSAFVAPFGISVGPDKTVYVGDFSRGVVDAFRPTAVLNGGSATALRSPVVLSSSVDGATEMRTSSDRTSWTAWRPYAENSLVALPGLPGDKTVWVQYRDLSSKVSELSRMVRLAGLGAWTHAGGEHSVAVKSDGSLWTWGGNSYGELGIGTVDTNPHTAPTRIADTMKWRSVGGGESHNLALTTDGDLYAWGDNTFRQVGIGGAGHTSYSPELISSAIPWATIASGPGIHSLGIKTDGSLWGWGANSYGQAGAGPTTVGAPQMIGGDQDWVAVAAGGFHSLAIKSNGSLWAWGSNGGGELGQASYDSTAHPSPARVGTGNNWVAVAAGNNFSIALRADGTIWGWGANSCGELGQGSDTPTNYLEPVQIGSDGNWTAIDAGSQYCMGVKTNGRAYSWGINQFGQLGLGFQSPTEVYSPTEVGTANGTDGDWTSIGSGCFHSLVLKADGSLWSWGYNIKGGLGDGSSGGYSTSPRSFLGLLN